MDRHYPTSRPRRLRNRDFLRRLTAENRLSPADLIMPLFVCENNEKHLDIPNMPAQERIPLNKIGSHSQRIYKLGIPAVALFPVVSSDRKTEDAAEAYNPQGLIPRAIAAIKDTVPELGVITDVALDPYTIHGQDGITNKDGEVLNDTTLTVLVKQSQCLVEAGSDVLAPSDMMDGRVGAIRNFLEKHKYYHTPILAYTAKYASAFYSPFRDAIGSSAALGKSNKLSYQMFPPNGKEAFYEAALDLAEGADIIMVKPGNFYADVIYRLSQRFDAPVFAYQVSGEYSMLCALAGENKDLLAQLMLESLIALKRAGATAILSYFALHAAEYLERH